MKKVLLAIIAVIVVVFTTACNSKNFTTEKWINSDNAKKYKYIEDFESKYTLVGMTSEDVKELLGEPYCEMRSGDANFDIYINENGSETDMFYYYRIKDDVLKGWEIYLIEFSNGVVIDTSIGIEDW